MSPEEAAETLQAARQNGDGLTYLLTWPRAIEAFFVWSYHEKVHRGNAGTSWKCGGQ